jgi:prenyltransferase beta subunit
MFRRMMGLILTAILLLALVVPVLAQDEASLKALDYLKTVQNEDGGLTNGFAPESDIATTADAVVAAILAGQTLDDWRADMMAYLEAQVTAGTVTAVGPLAKVLDAVIAAEGDTEDFGGHNLVDDLLAGQAENGVFGNGVFDHCLAMIALENVGIELPEGTVEALVAAQAEDGGWGFMSGQASDTNTTGLCLQALAPTDSPEVVQAGLDYLAAIQNEDGGWPYQSPSDYGTDSDSNSTALVIQALIASGEDLADWNNPQDWLLTMQLESGSFSFQAAYPGDNVPATVAAIPALEGQPYNVWALTAEAE